MQDSRNKKVGKFFLLILSYADKTYYVDFKYTIQNILSSKF